MSKQGFFQIWGRQVSAFLSQKKSLVRFVVYQVLCVEQCSFSTQCMLGIKIKKCAVRSCNRALAVQLSQHCTNQKNGTACSRLVLACPSGQKTLDAIPPSLCLSAYLWSSQAVCILNFGLQAKDDRHWWNRNFHQMKNYFY